MARKEWEKMINLKRSMGAAADSTIESHDYGFYNQRILETEYQVDNNLIKDYFPFDTVTDGTCPLNPPLDPCLTCSIGMLSVYQDILDLRFEEVHNAHTWHTDVRMFGVYDRTSNSFMGHFYLGNLFLLACL